MTDSLRTPATYADILGAPADVIAQIVDGVLETQARPAGRHALAASELNVSLGARFGRGRGGPGGWIILHEPELHLDADVLVPDLAGWRVERMPRVTDEPFFTLAPDWICEVLSPSTASLDRIRKMRVYLREAIQHVWLIDPLSRTLEVYRYEVDGWKQVGIFEGETSVRAEPFDAEAIDLGLLWIEEPPHPR